MLAWQERAVAGLDGIKIYLNRPMAELTTFKIGGPIDLLVEVRDVIQLQRILQFIRGEDLPWLVLGLGSNLLVRDKGIRGVGIRLCGEFSQWQAEGVKVTAGAGMTLADLAKGTACLGLSGLEFACGIPGTVGGAVFMNAGAYDGEMAETVVSVEAFDIVNGFNTYDRVDLGYGYRTSRFQKEAQVILRAVLQLEVRPKEYTEGLIAELTCKREQKQPLEWASAGSVFRRPTGHFVGPLIEAAGLKGYQIGGAQVSTKHAGFIINTGGATARDVLDLIAHVQNRVKQQNGVALSPEIRVIGEE